MADINNIICAIDEFLEKRFKKTTTPTEVNPFLEGKGLLNDSNSRPGAPLRKILRNGQVPHAYQIGAKWFIPTSGNKLRKITPIKKIENSKDCLVKHQDKVHKLYKIGELIKTLIEEKYKLKPICIYEYKPEWLFSFPSKLMIENLPELNHLYLNLVDNKFTLEERHLKLTGRNLEQKQSYDIWIGEPFNFAIEFDEKQHFNQYRKITLDFYENFPVKFPIIYYKVLTNEIKIKPGKSGFTKLKSQDPLFPELLQGVKQDNRSRQRAFRDFLKDLLPIENNCNPTLRIPYHITNKKISNFNENDLYNIKEYINANELL